MGKCPRCDSPSPERHPAMACEGEVQVCLHEFHDAATSMNLRYLADRILGIEHERDRLAERIERMRASVEAAERKRGGGRNA